MKKTTLRLLAAMLCLLFLLSSCQPATPPTPDHGNQETPDNGNENSGGHDNSQDGENNNNQGNENDNESEGEETEKDLYDTLYAPQNAPKEADRIAYTVEDDHGALGEGVGIHPGRVVWEHDDRAVNWNGSGYWFLEKNYQTDVIDAMVSDGICSLTGESDTDSAWDALFTYFNWRNYNLKKAYTQGEKIVIKCNMNGCGGGSSPTKSPTQLFTTPVVLRALLTTLVEYGVSPDDITVFDASRTIPAYMQELCSEGILSGVNFIYNARGGNMAQDAVADTDLPILWSEEFDCYADATFYPTCVTEADYMINISSLKPHLLAGFTASAKNHFGTVMPGKLEGDKYVFPNSYRDNPPTHAGLHPFVAAMAWNNGPDWTFPQRPMGSYTVLTDLLSNVDAGGKTVLYLTDALIVTANQNGTVNTGCKWLTMDGNWTNSLLFSQDPVAIDSVCYDFVMAERDARAQAGDMSYAQALPDGHTAQNYLHESALAYDPPSGTYYQDGTGKLISSLGVHEHWNNAAEKAYSRNLGYDYGIELVKR